MEAHFAVFKDHCEVIARVVAVGSGATSNKLLANQ